MLKRTLLKSICALPLWSWPEMSGAAGQITERDVSFDWRHTRDRLVCTFHAPTCGWLAVGFNAERTLKGTRFVIAARADDTLLVEEHIAIVPGHDPVEKLGLSRAVTRAEVVHTPGGSQLRFAYPLTFPDQPRLSLAPKMATHLLLAWSQDTDFDHHSAWRKHYDITL
ncbi:hypothetical protein ACOTTU_13465 [Roseobacter sp. EG26]|uniref:hypothetical protein n=1 Tax=Roseobacter sp. EG26 TaxID=3412477 RepID=UPI003CE5A402